MSTEQEIPDAILRRIQGLLNLADNNPSQEEAAAAAAKATKLMEEYNLTAAAVERAKGVDGKREDKYVVGGQYQWQRDLWEAVAKLHFCLYWTQVFLTKRETAYRSTINPDRYYAKGSPVRRKRHRLVGRVHNVAATKAMAEYLEQTINRILRERLTDSTGKFNAGDFNGGWGTSFREGMAAEIMSKLADRRRQALAKKPVASDASSGTAMVLSTYIDEETDKNMEFLWGKEYVDELKADATERRAMQERYTAWADANPEEAAKATKWTDPVTGRVYSLGKPRRSSAGSSRERNKDWGAWEAGRKAGKHVSIDLQTEGSGKTAAIAGPKALHL